jgi:hypothetical protein
MASGGRGEPAIGCDNRHVQGLREGCIHRVICGHVKSQGPSPLEKRQCWITSDRKIRQSFDRDARPSCVDESLAFVTTQDVEDFSVEEVGRDGALREVEDVALRRSCEWEIEQELDDDRSVDDAQRPPSRRRRMTAAGRSRAGTFNGGCSRSRFRTSSGVGLDAMSASSARRYSESEMPELAARALSVRCTVSGTSRTWRSLPIGVAV